MAKTKVEISKHMLVPKHVKLSDKEKKELFEKYNSTIRELPKILKSDPALASLGADAGNVIKIIRKSPTAGETTFYRVVING